jgi:phospholipid transport system substrate-binding protein
MAYKSVMKFSFVVSMLLSFQFLSSFSAVAEEAVAEPQAIVQDASDRMLKAIKDNKAKLEENPDEIYGLVETILMPNFDFDKMSKLALGKNWRSTTKAQQEKFTEQFRLLLIRTYSTAMLEYTDQEIRFLPFHDDLASKKVKVEMEIIQTGCPSIQINLSIYKN